MNRDQIIEALFMGKNFNDCLAKIEIKPVHLREDLKMEVISRICELDTDKVIGLHERNELEFYTVRVLFNELKNQYSGFSKKFKAPFDELTGNENVLDCTDHEERQIKETREDQIISEIKQVDDDDPEFVQKKLVGLYMDLGNYRAIEVLTQIPFITCYKIIQRYFESERRKSWQGNPVMERNDPQFVNK